MLNKQKQQNSTSIQYISCNIIDIVRDLHPFLFNNSRNDIDDVTCILHSYCRKHD